MMPGHAKSAAILIAVLVLLQPLPCATAQSISIAKPAPPIPAIVSTSHPKDSLGETVYESQGADQKSVPVVPGVLVGAKVVSMTDAEFSPGMRERRVKESVTVDCVVSSDGHPIDLKTTKFKDRDAPEAAEKAVREYRFKPATLDGKPIAWRTQVIVSFELY